MYSLNHVIDMDWMKEAYRLTRKDGAPGIDGVTATTYEANLMWTAPHVNCQLQHPQRYAVTSGYALRQGMAFAVPHQAPARRVHGACPSPPPQFSSSDGIWHRQIEPSSAWRTTARHGLTCDKRRPCQSPRVQPDTVQATSCVTQSRRAMLPAQRTSKRPHGHRQIRSRLSAFACHSISGCSYCLIGIPLRTDDDLSGQGPQADPSGLLRGNGRAWARRSVPHQAPARRVYGVPPLPPPQFPSYDGFGTVRSSQAPLGA